jgi:hypothetical protein
MEMLASRSGRITPVEKTLAPIGLEAGRTSEPVWKLCRENILPLSEFEHRLLGCSSYSPAVIPTELSRLKGKVIVRNGVLTAMTMSLPKFRRN